MRKGRTTTGAHEFIQAGCVYAMHKCAQRKNARKACYVRNNNPSPRIVKTIMIAAGENINFQIIHISELQSLLLLLLVPRWKLLQVVVL